MAPPPARPSSWELPPLSRCSFLPGISTPNTRPYTVSACDSRSRKLVRSKTFTRVLFPDTSPTPSPTPIPDWLLCNRSWATATLTEPTKRIAAPSANTLRMCCLLGELENKVNDGQQDRTIEDP